MRGFVLDNMIQNNSVKEGNKVEKNSYIVKELTPQRAYALVSDKVATGYKGLCITRTSPKEIKELYNFDASFVWLTDRPGQGEEFTTTSDIKLLRNKIKEFIKKNSKSIVLLDRVDYLISMHGFNDFLKVIYSVNDDIMMNDAYLVINVNPSTLSAQEISLLEQEMKELPKAKPELELEVADDLYEILSFVNYSEKKASFKDISKKFLITKTTARKRINKLVEKGLLVVKKNGRNKILQITENGKSML